MICSLFWIPKHSKAFRQFQWIFIEVLRQCRPEVLEAAAELDRSDHKPVIIDRPINVAAAAATNADWIAVRQAHARFVQSSFEFGRHERLRVKVVTTRE